MPRRSEPIRWSRSREDRAALAGVIVGVLMMITTAVLFGYGLTLIR